MKKTGKKRGLRKLLHRYRCLPRDLRSRKLSVKNRAQKLLTITICLPLMLWALFYIVSWEMTRRDIERDNAAFSTLYETPQPTFTAAPTPTLAPTATPAPVPTAMPAASPTAEPTAVPTSAPTAEPAASHTAAPAVQPTATPTIEPAITPSAAPTATPTSAPTATPVPTEAPLEVASDATIAPLATANADTIVYALETPPPTQRAFGDLLSLNPDTIGFLQVGSALRLPVVQKPNDNDYYLNHSFDNQESIGGTLFLDGSNLLVPEDASLIIYGHNMRNGTMFRPLINYEKLDFLKSNPLVQFDTIYQNRNYVPFAVFTVSADPGSDSYVNIRQFMFDEAGWDQYIADIRAQSVHSIPVDVQYGDSVLLLVTCEYTHNNGRFVVALRAQRENESTDELIQRIQAAY